ncbi:RNA polymerase I associated factor, A49-like protein [Irpex rosettiformis]|uniref:RNA polymerase I associated factor, A49-like protein n=1 Tax=Irpex rosettiformis TaxID=378272 RepID=A0ACB8UDB3_9APHY|nr:RNA polymerase I associated factor, A49-like protein [Irpex rosettiformis]
MSNISKKRKRAVGEDSGQVSIKVAKPVGKSVAPVLASFPAIQPPNSTPFKLYLKKGAKDASSAKDTLLVGETDTVEFVSTEEGSNATAGCSYYVGVYNKRTKTTTVRPAPLHILTRQVKALKNLKPMEVSVEERIKQRNKLGETFGTKKAQSAIRAQERNRVDVDAMRAVAVHLQESIQQNTENLPTQEEAKAAADSNRLIPPYDENASRPDDVYKLHDIIPEAEFNALSIAPLKSAGSNKERQAMLPYSRSNWINQHLNLVYSTPRVNKNTVKTLMYISTLFAFKNASRIIDDKQKLQERLKHVPSIIIDGLLSRFTQTSKDKNEARITPEKETMLLTSMFALCLRVDDYATDTSLLSKDLSMATSKINPLFKSLGCKIETLSAHDLKRLGLPDTAADSKRAVLKLPLVFPQVRVKRTRR